MKNNSSPGAWDIIFNRIPKIKKYLFLSVLYQVINGIDYLFWSVVYLRFIMYCIESELPYRIIILCFVLLSAVMFVFSVYCGWFEIKKNPIEKERIQSELNKQICEKIYDLSIIQLEKESEIREKFLIMHSAQEKVMDFLYTFSALIGRLVMCLSVFLIVVSIDKYVFIILLLPILSARIFGGKLNSVQYKYNQINVPGNLKKSYVKRCYSEKRFSGEIKTTNISNALNGLYSEGSQSLLENNRKYAFSRISLSFLIEFFKNRIPYSFILGYAVYQVMIAKNLGVADISVVLIGLVNLSDRLGDLAGLFSSLKDSQRYIHDVDLFLNKQSLISEKQPGQTIMNINEAISISNVSFSYNNSSLALKNINIEIKKGEKVAFVGRNGSGKTTMVNLIMRLYDPDEGKIEVDGQCIKKYDIECYRKMFSVVQQDSKLFAFTVAENIMSRPINENDQNIIENSLTFCGLQEKIANVSYGLNKYISKEFDEDGIVFSGGEEKKIAIARAFARSAPIIILDEPTSSLDPISEDEILSKLLNACEGKTAIFVMHRLSFAKKVDRIFYFENGEILEAGSHNELMEFNGRYADLFKKHMSNYLV